MALIGGSQIHLGLAFAKAGHTSLPFKGDRVALGRLHIRQRDPAVELGRYRTDLHGHDHRIGAIARILELLAAGQALLQGLRIVERLPGLLLAHGKRTAGMHFHGVLLFNLGAAVAAASPDGQPVAATTAGCARPAWHGCDDAVPARLWPAGHTRQNATRG